MYLVDTSAWIDFLNKKDDRLIPYLESREVCLTEIILYELLSGMPPEKQPALQRDLALFGHLAMTEEAIVTAAGIAAVMRRRKVPPQTTDMLIAGTALFHGASLIHRDKDFERIKNYCNLKTISFL